MKNVLGEKIAEIRKRKGLSQEQLADDAGINLRTVQRIENGETEPRGHTLSSICDVLDINIEDILNYGKVENKGFFVWFHLSAITGILIPFVLWLTNKDKIIGLDIQAKNLLLFRVCFDLIIYILMIGSMVYIMGIDVNTQTVDHMKDMASNMVVIFGVAAVVATIVTFIYPIYVAISIKKSSTLKSYYPRIFK